MFRKTLIVFALVGALSSLAQQAIAQNSSAGPWRRLANSGRGQTPADPERGGRGILAQSAGRDR